MKMEKSEIFSGFFQSIEIFYVNLWLNPYIRKVSVTESLHYKSQGLGFEHSDLINFIKG